MKTIIIKGFGITLLLCASFNLAQAQPEARTPQKFTTINITSFNAYAKENRICIDWATDGATETNVFEVQQSTDGQNFSTIAMVLGPDPKQQGDKYRFSNLYKDKQSNVKY